MKIDISSFFEYWTELANNNVFLTILIALLLPILEAILPFLPLVFIVNYNIVMFNAVFSFAGNWILALLVSALGAIIGAVLIFFLLKYSLGKWFRKKVEKNEKVVKAMEWINKVNTSYLIIIMSNPYTPTSIFNYAMALSGFATKKYLIIIVITKIIEISLLGLLGVVFKIGNSVMSFVWITLTYIILYVLVWLGKKCYLKRRKKDEQKNNERC